MADGTNEETKTILVADDEPSILALVRNVLEAAGYQVLAAENGEEAFVLGTDHGGEIDLLLVDIVLPGLNGPELAHRLSADRPGMKVIYMSGYGAGAGQALHQRDPNAIFVSKPFSPKELTALVGDHLSRE